MSHIAENLAGIHRSIAAACERAGRSVDEVKLIAVSKTFPAEAIAEAAAAGQVLFGESKLQEAEPKVMALPDFLEWHFIGRVQRNKVRKILQISRVIHAIDSLKLAAYVDQVAKELGKRPLLFLQVNASGEVSKGGFSPEKLRAEFSSISTLENIEVIGLMTIPPDDDGRTRQWFSQLRELRDELVKKTGANLPALSMGMSGDFEIAIEEGATHVRVGSAIFGKRAYRVDGELG
ncbi:MAG: YggS family pyridoxal phosphate-dependent enzyme [Luteolibacter sp.]